MKQEKNKPIRINRYLALCGLGSRRACETLVQEGKILIDSKICINLSQKIDPTRNSVFYNGKILKLPTEKVYYILNKPKGYLSSTHSQKHSKTVYHLLVDVLERVFYTGRLDQDSEGLMLFTNDGEMSYQLQNPRFHVPKTYSVIMSGFFHEKEKQQMERGIQLKDDKGLLKKTLPCKIKINYRSEKDSKIEITIYEGKKRQIRRMLDRFKHPVLHLKREKIGPISLGTLPSGKNRKLTPTEIKRLKALTS